MRNISFIVIQVLFFLGLPSLLLNSCHSGKESWTGPHFISAELDSFPTGSVPLNFTSAFVMVQDDSTGELISTATVTMNDVALNYNVNTGDYEGDVTVAPGGIVTLSVQVGEYSYTATGTQFTAYPALTTQGATWHANVANTVEWSAGSPTGGAFYGLGIFDAGNPNGPLVWPFDGSFQEIPLGTTSYSIPANTVSVGNRLIVAGLAKNAPIPHAAAGSTLLISGLNSVPITVMDDSGSRWTGVQVPTTEYQHVWDVIWAGTQFVTVGDYGTVLASSDGKTWTSPSIGLTNSLTGIAWSGTQFAALSGNTILTSPDLVTWTSRTSTSQSLSGIVWSGTQFVAVGFSGEIVTSLDGVTWTPRTSGTSTDLRGITWSGAQFVAVGGGYYKPGNNGTIVTSPDGVTWTVLGSGAPYYLMNVAWTGSQYVAVGLVGEIETSPDGTTWTSRTSGSTNALYGIASSGTNIVVVGQLGTILTSPDGVTWTPRTSPWPYNVESIAWSGTRYVAVCDASAMMTSP